MRSMSMYDLTLYLIVLALLEALCWWMGARGLAALFLALYAAFAVVSLRNDLILRYDGVVVVSRGKPYPLEWEDVERVARAYRGRSFEPVYRFTLKRMCWRRCLPKRRPWTFTPRRGCGALSQRTWRSTKAPGTPCGNFCGIPGGAAGAENYPRGRMRRTASWRLCISMCSAPGWNSPSSVQSMSLGAEMRRWAALKKQSSSFA